MIDHAIVLLIAGFMIFIFAGVIFWMIDEGAYILTPAPVILIALAVLYVIKVW